MTETYKLMLICTCGTHIHPSAREVARAEGTCRCPTCGVLHMIAPAAQREFAAVVAKDTPGAVSTVYLMNVPWQQGAL